jgi:hypothetical protein
MKKKRNLKVAFDIDDTLYKVEHYADLDGFPRFRQVPDYELIQVLKWFVNNKDEVYVWSAGGIDYAETIMKKLGLDKYVKIIQKGEGTDIDLCFDDEDVTLAKTNVQIDRLTHEF